MENNEFDRLLREKFKKESLKERPDDWALLSSKLSVVAKRKGFPVIKLAAAVLLLLGLSAGIAFLWHHDSGKVNQPELAAKGNNHRQPPSEFLEKSKENHLPVTEGEQSNSAQALVAAKKSTQFNISREKLIDSKSKTKDLLVQQGNATQQRHSEVSKGNLVAISPNYSQDNFSQTSPENSKAENRITGKEDHQKSVLDETSLLDFAQSHRGASTEMATAMDFQSATSSVNRSTSVALGGGMNYGALNTGYALGVSARQSLSKHLFVEGTVSFLYNNQASKASSYPGAPTTPSRPSSYAYSNIKAPSVGMISDFYFIQVNPSFGYQINKFLAFSVGADLQQRIASMSQNGTAVFTPSTDPKIIPKLDLGFTGKTEFLISPKIEAGLLYRNGLNNFLDPQRQFPYLNRRYLQVQLKYNFLLK